MNETFNFFRFLPLIEFSSSVGLILSLVIRSKCFNLPTRWKRIARQCVREREGGKGKEEGKLNEIAGAPPPCFPKCESLYKPISFNKRAAQRDGKQRRGGGDEERTRGRTSRHTFTFKWAGIHFCTTKWCVWMWVCVFMYLNCMHEDKRSGDRKNKSTTHIWLFFQI